MRVGGGGLRPTLLLAFASLATTIVTITFGTSGAFAAGSGYGPQGPPPGAVGAGFTTVIAAQTVSASGGSVSGSAFGATITVSVPRGSLPNGGEVVLAAGPPSTIDVGRGFSVIADCSVDILDPSTGNPLPGPFSPPISITINDPSIRIEDLLVTVPVPGQQVPVAGSSVGVGQAVGTFSSDPNFAVVRFAPATAAGSSGPPAGSPIAGSSTVHTGKPWSGSRSIELAGLASGLGLIGFGEILRRHRRRDPRTLLNTSSHLMVRGFGSPRK